MYKTSLDRLSPSSASLASGASPSVCAERPIRGSRACVYNDPGGSRG
ncbi:hypothetical protein [Lysobacter gummosus]